MDKDIVAAERDFLTPMGDENIKEEVTTEGDAPIDVNVDEIAQDVVSGANSVDKAEEAVKEDNEIVDVEDSLGDTQTQADESAENETAEYESTEDESTETSGDAEEEGTLSLDDLFTAIDELGDAPDETVEEIQADLAEEGISEESNNKLEELKTTLLEREQRISEIESSLNMYKSKLEEANDGLIDRDLNDSRIAPYINVLEDNDALKAAVVYLAKYDKNGNENMKEQSIDALYDYLSTETGHDIKGMIEKEITKDSEGLSGYEGGAGELETGSNKSKTLNLWD